MKEIAVIVLAVLASTAFAQTGKSHAKQGYVTKNGTYVAPSYSTNPNETKLDNYSTKGNINPYTGKAGTVDPYKVEPMKVEPYGAYKPPKY
jgi:hypothetical protein